MPPISVPIKGKSSKSPEQSALTKIRHRALRSEIGAAIFAVMQKHSWIDSISIQIVRTVVDGAYSYRLWLREMGDPYNIAEAEERELHLTWMPVAIALSKHVCFKGLLDVAFDALASDSRVAKAAGRTTTSVVTLKVTRDSLNAPAVCSADAYDAITGRFRARARVRHLND